MNFEKFIKEENCPLVFHNFISNWQAAKWTPEFLSDVLEEKLLKCKIGQKYQGNYETECLYLNVTINDLIDWCKRADNPNSILNNIDHNKYFCYVDYKYMSELFKDKSDILESIGWSNFGLTERNGKDSTIWIGSEGSTTPCHYDTYGFNLVAQIYGRKRWYLFPPSDTNNFYPSRIPYEESSVFTEVNIKNPDKAMHPNLKLCKPYVITLEPGDVLYVPKHWWHYVECLELSISVNTWVEMDDDKETRLQEAMTRFLLSMAVSTCEDHVTIEEWINPTEELQSMTRNMAYLRQSLSDLSVRNRSSCDQFRQFCETFKDYLVDNCYSDNKRKCEAIHQEPTKVFISTQEGDSIQTSTHIKHAVGDGDDRFHCDQKRQLTDKVPVENLVSGGAKTLDTEDAESKSIKNIVRVKSYKYLEYCEFLNWQMHDIPEQAAPTAESSERGQAFVSLSKQSSLSLHKQSEANLQYCGYSCDQTSKHSGEQSPHIMGQTFNETDQRQLKIRESDEPSIRQSGQIDMDKLSDDHVLKALMKSVLNPKVINLITDSFINQL